MIYRVYRAQYKDGTSRVRLIDNEELQCEPAEDFFENADQIEKLEQIGRLSIEGDTDVLSASYLED